MGWAPAALFMMGGLVAAQSVSNLPGAKAVTAPALPEAGQLQTAPTVPPTSIQPPSVPSELLDHAKQGLGFMAGPAKQSNAALPDPLAQAGLPQVALKGRVFACDRSPLALLEVNGNLHTVGKGNLIYGQGNLVLRIIELTATALVIEVAPMNERITLR